MDFCMIGLGGVLFFGGFYGIPAEKNIEIPCFCSSFFNPVKPPPLNSLHLFAKQSKKKSGKIQIKAQLHWSGNQRWNQLKQDPPLITSVERGGRYFFIANNNRGRRFTLARNNWEYREMDGSKQTWTWHFSTSGENLECDGGVDAEDSGAVHTAVVDLEPDRLEERTRPKAQDCSAGDPQTRTLTGC